METFGEEDQLKADKRKLHLQIARESAVRVAEESSDRRITIDDVQRELLKQGIHPSEIGNAAGSIFRGRKWWFTGKFVPSQRVSNNGRMIRVWELKR